jgi:hypothetical protein
MSVWNWPVVTIDPVCSPARTSRTNSVDSGHVPLRRNWSYGPRSTNTLSSTCTPLGWAAFTAGP